MGQAQPIGHKGSFPEAVGKGGLSPVERNSLDFEDFFENGNLALHFVGGEGTILHANRAELELLGYSAANTSATTLLSFMPTPM